MWQVLLPAFNATPEGLPCEVHADSKAETFSSTLKIAVQCKATDKLCNHNLHVDSKAEVLSSTLKIAVHLASGLQLTPIGVPPCKVCMLKARLISSHLS